MANTGGLPLLPLIENEGRVPLCGLTFVHKRIPPRNFAWQMFHILQGMWHPVRNASSILPPDWKQGSSINNRPLHLGVMPMRWFPGFLEDTRCDYSGHVHDGWSSGSLHFAVDIGRSIMINQYTSLLMHNWRESRWIYHSWLHYVPAYNDYINKVHYRWQICPLLFTAISYQSAISTWHWDWAYSIVINRLFSPL